MTWGKLSAGSMITAIILLVIAFKTAAVGIPQITSAGNEVNGTGVPFASFFASDGIVILALMGALILGVVGYLGYKTKR